MNIFSEAELPNLQNSQMSRIKVQDSWAKALVDNTHLSWTDTTACQKGTQQKRGRGSVPNAQEHDRESAIAQAKQNKKWATLMVTDARQHTASLCEASLQLQAEQYAKNHNLGKASVQPLIKKDQGSPKITRLYQIVLLNAAMNMGF